MAPDDFIAGYLSRTGWAIMNNVPDAIIPQINIFIYSGAITQGKKQEKIMNRDFDLVKRKKIILKGNLANIFIPRFEAFVYIGVFILYHFLF